MKKRGIYAITCLATQKAYVGKSTDIQDRKQHHFSSLRRGRHDNKNLQKDFDLYGEEQFVFTILVENSALTDDELNNLEKEYIAALDSFENGYNFTLGGQGSFGYKHDEQVKMIRSEYMKQLVGEKNTFYGKHHTEETKKLISERNKGRLKGIPKSEDHKRKIREGNIKTRGKAIICEGVKYNTVTEAAQALNITPSLVRYRIKSNKYDYHYAPSN